MLDFGIHNFNVIVKMPMTCYVIWNGTTPSSN